jgi:pimeloyl-ACP methyl ester carboxylesterase
VVAHSFGAMLALRWLTTRGDTEGAKVHGVVLIAASAGPLFDRVRVRLGGVLGRGIRIPFAPFYPAWNSALVTKAMKRLTSRGRLYGVRQDFRTLARPSDFALDLAGWRNTDWRAMRAFRHALAGFDVRADLGRVQVPVIVLHGTRDALFPVSEAEALAAGLPRGELRVIRGAGHGLPVTHGGTVVEAVLDVAASPRVS